MLIRRGKLIIATGLCLLLGFLMSNFIEIKAMANGMNRESELPIRKLEVTIDKSQQERLFNQFRKFSDKHGFAIRIAPTTPNGEDFSIQMWREDFKIFGDNPFDSGKFAIGIYENDESTKKIPSTYLDELIGDLKTFITEVPNATFSEQQ